MLRDSARIMLCVVMAGCSLVANEATAQVAVQTVALSGWQAPDVEAGLTVGSLVGLPVINNAGEVAFGAYIMHGHDWPNDMAIWAGTPGSVSVVARAGQEAPGTGGAQYQNLHLDRRLTLGNNGQVAFWATLQGAGVTSANGAGVWSGSPGAVSLMARGGDPAPDVSDDACFKPYVSDGTQYPPDIRINGMGQVAFEAGLNGSSVQADQNDWGIWSAHGGTTQLVARRGDPAPGTPQGVSYYSHYANTMALNDAGQSAYVGYLAGPGVSGDYPETNSGIWLGRPDEMGLAVRAGDAAPGAPAGVKFRYFETNGYVGLNNAGQVAFEATLTSDATGIWAGAPGHLAAVAQTGDPAPGTGGAWISVPDGPALNHAGQVAFTSYLAGGNVQNMNDNQALWLWSPGDLSLVCRAGDHAPGTAEGVTFRFLGWPALNSTGQMAFFASLVGPGVAGDNVSGIWARDTDGAIHLVVREGDLLEVGAGDFRRIAELSALLGSGGEDGRGRAMNDLGQIAFRAHFTDGSYGVFVTSVPEPATLVLLGVGGVAALRRREQR